MESLLTTLTFIGIILMLARWGDFTTGDYETWDEDLQDQNPEDAHRNFQ